MSDPAGRRKAGAALLYLIAAIGLPITSLLSAIPTPLLSGVDPYLRLLILDCVYYIPFVVLPVFLYTRRDPQRYDSYRPGGFGIITTIVLAALAFNAFVLCNNATVLWAIPFQKLGMNIYAASLPKPTSSQQLILYVISAGVLPAVCEEFLFRGVVLTAFEDKGTKRAVIMTSLMFAFMHSSLIGMPAEFIAGIMLALICINCRSIYAAMAFHTMYNTITIIMDYKQTAEASKDLLTALGGLGGIFSITFNIVLILIFISFLLRMLSVKARMEGVRYIPRTGKADIPVQGKICLGIAGLSILFMYVADFMSMLT